VSILVEYYTVLEFWVRIKYHTPHSMPYVADQTDYLAVEAEWRHEWTKLTVPMTLRVGALRGHYSGVMSNPIKSSMKRLYN